MSVRFRLALTVFLAGLATAVGVIVAVGVAFLRFEHESLWQRGDAFVERVVAQHDDLLELQRRNADEFTAFLRSLVLYEPGSQLYLLDANGAVLAHTGQARLPPGFTVALAPVQRAAEAAAQGRRREAAYVMGDDPEYMNHDAVVAARPLQRAVIRKSDGAAGYLYLVCRKNGLPASKVELLASSLASPALLPVLLVVVLGSALAAWIIVTVTRPLRVLSDEVAEAARAGFGDAELPRTQAAELADDEFGRLRGGFHALLARLRRQWDELRRMDHFRRESVSNLSHDLRSPLTATVACLETLEQRWVGDTARDDDRRLVQVALRNTRNAAGLVRSLGDLALLDEPEFKLNRTRLDLTELLDDITMRFAPRAASRGVALRFEPAGDAPAAAEVDAELFERALANLLDNALKFTPAGKAIVLALEVRATEIRISVRDEGTGIASDDVPHLFDRHYQSRNSTAPASSDEGKGLGLAIVKRIVELHGGSVGVTSAPGQGTTVTLRVPAA